MRGFKLSRARAVILKKDVVSKKYHVWWLSGWARVLVLPKGSAVFRFTSVFISCTLFLALIFFNKPTFAKNIPHPLDFNGSEQGKKNIISFIEKNVYETYCENEMLKSMCTNSLLRMMEDEELTSFKKLTKAKVNENQSQQKSKLTCSRGRPMASTQIKKR